MVSFRFVALPIISGVLIVAGCKTSPTNNPQAQIPPRLIEPLKFANFTVSELDQEGAHSLINAKVYTGTTDTNAYHFLTLSSSNSLVETVNEYRQAKQAGFSAQTTADISTESWFIDTDRVLSFMERAQSSRRSLFTAKDLKFLPVSLLNWTEGGEHAELIRLSEEGMTLNDCTRPTAKHRIHSLKLKDNGIMFSDDGCDYDVSELCRGDVDGDGYEDALVLIATYYRGGSGRAYQTFVVSKTGVDRRRLKVTDTAK